MQDERARRLDVDQLGEIFLRFLGVDEGRGVVPEDAEVPVDMQIDGRRLHVALVERLDDDAAGLPSASWMERSERITAGEPTRGAGGTGGSGLATRQA